MKRVDSTTELLAALEHNRNVKSIASAANPKTPEGKEYVNKIVNSYNANMTKEDISKMGDFKELLNELGLKETSKDLEHLLKKKYSPALRERFIRKKLYQQEHGIKSGKSLDEIVNELEGVKKNAKDNQVIYGKLRNSNTVSNSPGKIPLGSERSNKLENLIGSDKRRTNLVNDGSEFNLIYPSSVNINKDRATLPTKLHEHYHGKHFESVGNGDAIYGFDIVRKNHKQNYSERVSGTLPKSHETIKSIKHLNQETHATGDGLRAGWNAGMTNEEMKRALDELGPAYNTYVNSVVKKSADSEIENITKLSGAIKSKKR